MRGRILMWIFFFIILQMNDNAANRVAQQRAQEAAERDRNDREASNGASSGSPFGAGPRVLGLRYLSDLYRNESDRIRNLTFDEGGEDLEGLRTFTKSLVKMVSEFNSSGAVVEHDPVKAMMELWNVSSVSGKVNETSSQDSLLPPLSPAELKKIPHLDLPIARLLAMASANATLKRYLAPHVFYRNLSATFTGKYELVDLESRLPDISGTANSSFFRLARPMLLENATAIFGGAAKAARNSSRSGIGAKSTDTFNATASNHTVASNATFIAPNPLSVFNATLARFRRGTVLSTNSTLGSLSLTLFGNRTVTDDVDFLSAHLVLKPGEPPHANGEAAFVGYGLHDLASGAVWIYLVPPGRDLPLEELLELLPRFVFEKGKGAAIRFLAQRIENMADRIESEGEGASETFGSGQQASPFGFERVVQPSCSFEIHMQMEPLGRPYTEQQVVEFTEQVHGAGDGRSVPRLPRPGASMLVYSRDCLLAFEAPSTTGILLPNFFGRLTGLALALFVVSGLELAGILAQFRVSDTLGRLAKVSLWTLGTGVVHDAMLSAAALVGSMVLKPIGAPLAALAFVRLVSCAVFQGRYVMLVLRSRRIEVTPQGFRKFYAVWMLCMVLFLTLGSGGWFVRLLVGLAVGGMWLGQVFTNIRRNNRSALHPLYLVGTTVSKFFLPLYYFGCPANVIWPDSEGSTVGMVVVFGYAVAQMTLLFSQDLWGGRWFLPKELFPPAYDYHPVFRPPDLESGPGSPSEAPSCAICYTPLHFYPTAEDAGPVDRSKYMITPCGHQFCSACLSQWMEEKMECPVCRRILPGLGDGE